MPIGISEEHEALRQAARGWVERHCAPAVPRSALDAETESLPPFWADLAAQGWLGLHVDEALGGEGYGLPELAVVLEELGRACAPGPFVPTVLTAAVLQAAGKEIAADIVPGLASGETVGTVALGGRLDAEPAGDGLQVRGTLRAVPSAHLAGVLVARAGDEWCALVAGEFTATELQSLDPTRRVAEVHVDAAVVPNARRLDGVETARVRDLAAAVFAAESVGVAQWCVDTASEYAKVREQFGRPIGQFQGVKHKCADMLADTELARAAAWDAARAADEPDVAPLTAAAAASLAIDAAYGSAKDCIQVHGGIGFTWEHDAHLYLKRATATRQLLGPTSAWRVRAAEAAPRRRAPPSGRRPAAGGGSTTRRGRRLRCRGQGPRRRRATAPARRRRVPRTAVAEAVGARRQRARAAGDRRRVPQGEGAAAEPERRRVGPAAADGLRDE